MKDLHVTVGEGYTKRSEGDVWQEGGKTWTIKNGIKRTVTKMDEARKQMLTPLACPTCGSSMNHHLDEKMWGIHKMCFNCVIDMEHEIRKQGKWKEYERQKMTANAESFLKDLQQYVEYFQVDEVSKAHVTEDGVVEKWRDVNPEHLKKISDEVVETVTKNIENYKNELK